MGSNESHVVKTDDPFQQKWGTITASGLGRNAIELERKGQVVFRGEPAKGRGIMKNLPRGLVTQFDAALKKWPHTKVSSDWQEEDVIVNDKTNKLRIQLISVTRDGWAKFHLLINIDNDYFPSQQEITAVLAEVLVKVGDSFNVEDFRHAFNLSRIHNKRIWMILENK